MKTVTKTALANAKRNRGSNILCGLAISLTTLLIFVILTVIFGSIEVEHTAVNAFYPTWHTMLYGVPESGLSTIRACGDLEKVGIREDFGQLLWEDGELRMLAMDAAAIELNRVSLQKGAFPESTRDVAMAPEVLRVLGIQAEVGDEITLSYQLYEDNGLGYENQDTFVLSGLTKNIGDGAERKQFPVYFSMDYMKEKIPETEREYQVMLRLSAADGMMADQITDRSKEIAGLISLTENDILENSEYLMANYIDPTTVPVVAGVIIMVMAAGSLTISSIYYVSMIPRVQEYGRLKALGASKRQIRQIVFREGMLVTCLAMPAGVLISSVISVHIVKGIYGFIQRDSGQLLVEEAGRLLDAGEIQLLKPWIYGLTIAVVLATVTASLLGPMRKASKISPIEAMNYTGSSSRKKTRRGYQELNIRHLIWVNLAGNGKRTVLTVAALGMTGIFFVVAATVLACIDPDEQAKEQIEADYRIEIESWDNDKMHPDREWSNIQQNNPMDDAFLEQLRQTPGVEKVQTKTFLDGQLPEYPSEDGVFPANVIGLDKSYKDQIEEGIQMGAVTYEELEQGQRIILTDRYLHYWFPEVCAGDTIKIKFNSGGLQVERSFEIAAFGKYNKGLDGGADFILPSCVLAEISPYNLNYQCEITVKEEEKDTAYSYLETLAQSSPYFETASYESAYKEAKQLVVVFRAGAYAFLLILGSIGSMTLINTMINSIYSRKHELGMIQSIGMSEKQLLWMLQLEGMFYMAGVLLTSLSFGNLAGYGLFLKARAKHLLNIQTFHYPAGQVVILAAAVILLQLVLTYLVAASLKKQSLIDRVRYSE